MLDVNVIRNNPELVQRKVKAKGGVFSIEKFNALDQFRRSLLIQYEELKSEKNRIVKEIGRFKKEGVDASAKVKESIDIASQIGAFEEKIPQAETDFQDFLLNIPNLHHDSVPFGADAAANVIVREWGRKPEFAYPPRPHWELGDMSGCLDFVRAAKISGSRFALYFDNMARLERSLIHLMLETHTRENGYREVLPPFW